MKKLFLIVFLFIFLLVSCSSPSVEDLKKTNIALVYTSCFNVSFSDKYSLYDVYKVSLSNTIFMDNDIYYSYLKYLLEQKHKNDLIIQDSYNRSYYLIIEKK